MAEISPKVAPYGSFESPITAEMIVSKTVRLSGASFFGSSVVWLEARPHEKGRQVVNILDKEGKLKEFPPAPFNVRTRVHEYGGSSYNLTRVGDEEWLVFANFADQKLYKININDDSSAPVPISREKFFFACGNLDAKRNSIYYVREDHTKDADPSHPPPPASIVRVDLGKGEEEGEGEVVAEGHDFFATPTLSPDGQKLSYVTWENPNMPWDNTKLWVATVADDGKFTHKTQIRGHIPEAVMQPRYSPGGVLHFISDEAGFWNIYRLEADGTSTNLLPLPHDFCFPPWTLGQASYQFLSEHEIIATYKDGPVDRLIVLDTQSKNVKEISFEYSQISSISAPNDKGEILIVASSPSKPAAVVLVQLHGTETKCTVLARSSTVELDEGYISTPSLIQFPSENGRHAYALFYAPKNKDFTSPPSTLPPLIVYTHGGPTANASADFNLKIQFWTSRGFAIADVDYGGSSGYGRAYRDVLKGQWGIVDLDDCCACVKYLTHEGLIDPKRTAIEGGSAGGYTTLACLAFRPGVFQTGVSHYGVGDLESLALETHKFEAKYLDQLIGPYPAEKQKYYDRSPSRFVDNFSVPMALFHGLEDKIVPPAQSQELHAALKKKGIPVLCVLLEGEQHGFRQSENIIRVLNSELYFYSKVFGFTPADKIEPVEIDNLA